MLPDHPNGAELLEIAYEVLRSDVARNMTPGQRLDVLMAANAVGIARRELLAGDTPWRQTRAELAALYGFSDDKEPQSLERLTRRVAADIRHGKFDEGKGAASLHAALTAASRRRLKISNPRYLDGLDPT